MKRIPIVLCSMAIAGLVLAMASGCASYPLRNTTALPAFAQPFTPINAATQNMQMTRGVNVLGYDPVWTDPAKGRFQPRHFKIIHDGGFSAVRIALFSFDHMDSSNQLNPEWLMTLDTMVKAAVDEGLIVILDEHDFLICGKDAAVCKTKLNAFWTQIAPRFKDAPNTVIFEVLNEPHDAMTAEIWNPQLRETLAIIRATNPTRNVIVGPAGWNGMEQLPTLDLPADDQHIIVTFHDYHPMNFTHQGAAWAPAEVRSLSGVTWGSDADVTLLNKEFDTVKAWSDAHHRPIYLGEFGAYDKAPMESRVKWTAAMARGAEARGFSWGYWQLDGDFILYDLGKDEWVKPIRDALIPPAN